jgi:hypothetical protein
MSGPRGRRVLLAAFLLTLPLVTPRLRGADEIEYFAYLRSAVFDRDLDFENEYRHFHARDPEGLAGFRATFLDRREEATGRPINFAPLGSALLWSPFYLLAHAGVRVAGALGATIPADGFSTPYVAAVCFASALYGFLGLLLSHAMLLRFGAVSDAAATLAVLALWLGSPVLYYVTLAPGFAHAASLFATALLIWLFLRARARPPREGVRLLDWVLVGAAGGLAALVREQDGLLLVVPGAWLLWEARRRLRASLLRGAVMVATAVLVFAPQLLAYRAINGRFGPSRLVGRKMSYTSPHLLEVLFDPAHGLFFWSPLLLLAVAGLLVALARPRDAEERRLTALLGLGLLAQAWINGCIESWSQAGAFGSRRFVGVTVVFAWGLGLLLHRLQPRLGRVPVAAAMALFMWWNVSLMIQFGLRLMDRQRLSWPRVAVNQFTEVPPRLARVAVLFLTDRERLVRESR